MPTLTLQWWETAVLGLGECPRFSHWSINHGHNQESKYFWCFEDTRGVNMSSSNKVPYLKEVICSVYASMKPSPQSRWWTCPSPPEVPSCPLIAPHSPLLSFRQALLCFLLLQIRLRVFCSGGLVAQLRPALATPWAVACPWDFSRQEYWSGLPFPSRGSSRPRDQTLVSYISCIAGGFFYRLSHQGRWPITFSRILQVRNLFYYVWWGLASFV